MTQMFTIQAAADYVRGLRMPSVFVKLLRNILRVFDFREERWNRTKRFVEIVKRYREGVPVSDIEREFGCSRGTILRYARLAGLDKREKGFGEDTRATVLALYKARVPIADISKECDVSPAYVSKLATAEGINRRNFKKRNAK